MRSTVELVVCVDTEGPCDDPASPELLSSWERLDAAVDKLFDPPFRARHPDSSGGLIRFGWFFLTWSGFKTNPRNRDFGYHKVRDHYHQRWGGAMASFGDEHCWHYHHPSSSGVGNEWGLDFSVGQEFANIISRQILERDFFPVCYRAGGTIMDARSSRWVDSWFPVDYTNRAPVKFSSPPMDWSSGVAEWRLYHPSAEDFRRPGSGRRRMARCLDLASRLHVLSDHEIEAAFVRAEQGLPALLACFDHDYRDIASRLDDLRARVAAAGKRHTSVEWRYAAPVEAVRRYLDAAPQPPLEIEVISTPREVRVWSSAPLFQSFPWLAIRTSDGSVRQVEAEIERVDECHWLWRPGGTDWMEAAFAGSTDLGSAAVAHLRRDGSSPGSFMELDTPTHGRRPRSIWEHSKLYPSLCSARARGELAEMDSVRQAVALLRSENAAPRQSVLDVGCGAGHAFRSLRELGLEYHGIDSYARGIEIGRAALADLGLPGARLRVLAVEDLPPGEQYDYVICLSTLGYCPQYHLPLEAMARAARRLLVLRASFGSETRVRYLPDVLLEPGHQAMRSYFQIWSRSEVAAFLESEGFACRFVEDERQASRFGGAPEIVGGIALPYEFLVATRLAATPDEDTLLGPDLRERARAWREGRRGGPDQ